MKKKGMGALVAAVLAFGSFGGSAFAAPKEDPDPNGTQGFCVTNHKEETGEKIGDTRKRNRGAVADLNEEVRTGERKCR